LELRKLRRQSFTSLGNGLNQLEIENRELTETLAETRNLLVQEQSRSNQYASKSQQFNQCRGLLQSRERELLELKFLLKEYEHRFHDLEKRNEESTIRKVSDITSRYEQKLRLLETKLTQLTNHHDDHSYKDSTQLKNMDLEDDRRRAEVERVIKATTDM
jgi:hypothetical protein